MTRLASILVLAVVLATASSASASVTRTRLWTAMHGYAECRANPAAVLAGDISSARIGGPVTFETLMSNKAALVVRAGNGPHDVRWITSHGVVQLLFHFRHLRNVAARLDAAC